MSLLGMALQLTPLGSALPDTHPVLSTMYSSVTAASPRSGAATDAASGTTTDADW